MSLCQHDVSEYGYIELIRLAISIKMFVLTGKIWKVSVRCDFWDFQFRVECEGTKLSSHGFDPFSFDGKSKMDLWVIHIDSICIETVHRFMRNMRLFDLPVPTLESIGIIDV